MNASLSPTSLSSAEESVSSTRPSALYQQVREYISSKIGSREWQPGDRVPSEQELVNLFGISRMTVNRALRELAEQGVVVRIAGVGTFVAEEKSQSTLLQIANLADDIRMRGHAYRCEVLSVKQVAATADVAVMLDLRTGQPVVQSRCVHYENEVAVQFEDRFVNPQAAPHFQDQTFDQETPAEYLLRNVPFDEVEHVVEAMLPTAKQAKLLQMDPNQPCLVLTRRTWILGKAITFVKCFHPSRRYRLGSRFRLDSAKR
ncbi:histidine utilization repressor [Bordetella petrii]|nr:histidine utilization repressor [Bordetella petrii]